MSEYVPQELLDGWIVAHDKQRARAEAAEAELERLHSWQGLLELLDEHWPDDIFPTLTDDAERDTGPRLVSALRRADKAERKVARIQEYLHGKDPALWARAEAAERDRDLYMDAWREEKQQRIDTEAALARDQLLREVAATDEETT